ncbi:hypothetical protein MHUMG1_04713 [Metarhizium humberi]|uniref:Uncharacterized protein n=1 Tax=Metarhizium humberi TaxID=2596975 RepID=A0A9P8MBV8_9HYPO|nr:hypothetical protein MHUMG1_04713 [Metarhizium humberi]
MRRANSQGEHPGRASQVEHPRLARSPQSLSSRHSDAALWKSGFGGQRIDKTVSTLSSLLTGVFGTSSVFSNKPSRSMVTTTVPLWDCAKPYHGRHSQSLYSVPPASSGPLCDMDRVPTSSARPLHLVFGTGSGGRARSECHCCKAHTQETPPPPTEYPVQQMNIRGKTGGKRVTHVHPFTE